MKFIIPEYTNFHKFLLVEDIVFTDNPVMLHYGKCNVIGYLHSPDCLQSLTIPYIKKEYQLPDAALSLKIHCDHYPTNCLHSTVRIYGEVRIIDKDKDVIVQNFESSQGLIHRLRELQRTLELSEGKDREPSGTDDKSMSLPVRIKLEKEINSFSQRYLPIIYVESIKPITLAKEIIYENLQYRLIRKKCDNILRDKT